MISTCCTEENSGIESVNQSFQNQGYAIVRKLFNDAEVEEIRNEFAKIHANGPIPKLFEPVPKDKSGGDPLKEYPRVMHPHRFSSVAKKYMTHAKVEKYLSAFFESEPLAAQSMFYFKPPGARGQALHQDNFYLMVNPGTCIAAWTAIDDCDAQNGAMYVVPGSQKTNLVCPDEADSKESFTKHFVPVPKGMKAEVVNMKAGDTLFFNGSVIHGSGPNRTKDRFRRAFICHYAAGSTEKISRFYLPLHRMDGTPVTVEANIAGGPCGEAWEGSVHY